MKGYFVWVGDEWGEYVHGETANKAKSMMWKSWGIEIEWVDMRPIRIPELDNIPITNSSIQNYIKKNIPQEEQELYTWHPICGCEVCKRN